MAIHFIKTLQGIKLKRFCTGYEMYSLINNSRLYMIGSSKIRNKSALIPMNKSFLGLIKTKDPYQYKLS